MSTETLYDPLRRKEVADTPEERVRRHAIGFLMSHCGAELRSVATEYPVGLNGTSQRADIVVFDGECRPAALVECKATDVRIGPDVLAQAVRYNSVLGARSTTSPWSWWRIRPSGTCPGH